MLRDIPTPESARSRIQSAILWIRENFTSLLHTEALAERVAMGV